MTDFGAGLIAGGCIIVSVVVSVVEILAYGHRQELIDLLRERIEQCEDELR